MLKTKSFEKPGGPVRRSVDWHFGHRPDFILHLLAVHAGSSVDLVRLPNNGV
jgi:hypothetical protein